ncbi:helix-turn-helix domain-containing protein [Cellulosimicrobium sp. PMB13]|uniref:MerR family transcriptional regulator n=1 Tax=Cellulosimicrobium sp. PMB13 TaxID=3120158 RepID=UPI003F4C2C09
MRTDPDPAAGELTSGAMARASGLSPKALRLYDANGLLVPARVDPRTGYRAYAAEQVTRGRTIALLRRLDMPLATIRDVLDAGPDRARDVLLAWWSARQAELAARRDTLHAAALRIGALPDPAPRRRPGPVRERRSPARKVATVTAVVDQDGLVPRFTADVLGVRAHLAAQGATWGTEHWVVYHEPPGPTAPGRIETCVPYDGTVDPSERVTLRVEPGRTELVVPVPAVDCRYPRILAYSEAVLGAARDRGGAAGPTREVYPVPWSDDDDALVAEVVVPVDPAPGAGRTVPS